MHKIVIFSILLIMIYTKQGFTMKNFEKEIVGNKCIHHENPPLESIFYKFDTVDSLILPKGKFLVTANVNIIANVISKKIRDETILLIGLYSGKSTKDQIEIDDQNIVHKGIGKYFTAGSYGWAGGIVSLEKILKIEKKTEINVYLGFKKSSSGKPKYEALCITGETWGKSYIRAIKLD